MKNKATLPSDVTRFTTAFDVAKLITDPAAQNRRFVAPLGNNRFSLYNCENPIRDKDVGTVSNWWTIENSKNKIHITNFKL